MKTVNKWAVGFAKEAAQRTKAGQIALAAAIAFDLEDFMVLRRQFLEFIKMCKAVGIETDTELEITMADKQKGADTDIDEAPEEQEDTGEKDWMPWTITHVSNDKHFGFVNNEMFVHRGAFEGGHNQLEVGAKIEYEVEWNPKKFRMNAKNVVVPHQSNEEK